MQGGKYFESLLWGGGVWFENVIDVRVLGDDADGDKVLGVLGDEINIAKD